MSRLVHRPLQYLPPREDGLARTAAALQHQIAVRVSEQRKEGLVIGLPQPLVPRYDFIELVDLLAAHGLQLRGRPLRLHRTRSPEIFLFSV